jgi:hypothetical protein
MGSMLQQGVQQHAQQRAKEACHYILSAPMRSLLAHTEQ